MSEQLPLVENYQLANWMSKFSRWENLINDLLLFLCFGPAGTIEEVKANSTVDFLGMSVDSAAAAAGQWVLLVVGVVLLLATIILAYKYRKSRKPYKSSSTMELKQKD